MKDPQIKMHCWRIVYACSLHNFKTKILFRHVSIAVTSCRDVQDYMHDVRGNDAYGQFVWPACRRPLSRLTQSRARQIGIDGEHRPFRIIPALSVTKRESAGDFTPDPARLRRFIRFCPDDAAATYFTPIAAYALLFFFISSARPPSPPELRRKKEFRQCSCIRDGVDHDGALQTEWSAFMRFGFRRHARVYRRGRL